MHSTMPMHSMGGRGFVLAIPCLIVPLLGLLLLAFWLWMLIDCLTRDFSGNDKIVWVLVILFLNLLGALIYFFVGRGQGAKRMT